MKDIIKPQIHKKFFSLLTIFFLLTFAFIAALPAKADSPQLNEYPVPTSTDPDGNPINIGPISIATGSDGNEWFPITTQRSHVSDIDKITPTGDITVYHLPNPTSQPTHVTLGTDGQIWFTEGPVSAVNPTTAIGKIDTSGNVTEYPLSSTVEALNITTGPDGAMWFTQQNSNGDGTGNKIGRIDTSGNITYFPVPDNQGAFTAISTGSDGALWFGDDIFTPDETEDTGIIYRMATDGSLTTYPLSSPDQVPFSMTTGPDGALWFSEEASNNIGHMDMSGNFTEYPTPDGNFYITEGPDNAVWFSTHDGIHVGRIDTSGNITQYALSLTSNGGDPAPLGITSGPNNTIWVSEQHSLKIGEFLLSGSSTQAPTITSTDTETANVQSNVSFQVTTTGSPTPAITETGALPHGITFTDNSDDTATLEGIPAIGSAGTYPLTITADNGSGSPATQSFTLTITNNPVGPAFLSTNSDTETFGVPFSFTVQTSGNPVPKITKTGALPAGITFADNGDGTATIAGTPSKSAVGVYTLTLKAKNTVSTAAQVFTLTITKAPVFKTTPAKNLKTTPGAPYSLTVTVSGYDTPTITQSGTLPNGVSFVDNGNGTATISGTTDTNSAGAYPFTLSATNSYGTANESLTINDVEGPAITSADTANATVGSPFNFQVTTTGFPKPTVSKNGTLPKGITFQASTDTFSGTPKAGSTGTYSLTITAKNSVGATVIPFTLTVN